MTSLDLLVFGDTAIDNFYEVHKLPKVNEAGEVTKARRFYGGMGANTAVVASNLGLKTGLVSVIGTDAEDYRKYMESKGIKLFLKGVFGDTTRSMFFKTDGDQISFFYKGVTEMLEDLDPDAEFDKALPRDVKVVYMARTYLEMQKKVVDLYKGRFIVYNPGYGVFKFDKIPKMFRSIIKGCNILILNNHELEHLRTMEFEIKSGLGPEFVIITRGERGCSVYSRDTKVDVAAYPAKAIDTSGAGDAFNAGFITAQLKGYDIYESVKIGNATASFTVEQWGCQTNLPSWSQVLERHDKI
ncbi:MAG: PfkB family carbohydrate kinase [Candidatus Altiarchaeota archaeon]|nr:PfkB family carbohydrate kinase [Candidatus Altiarchaeota archaeon]